jgi:GNAT superfamily N-acetyltransferase
MAGEELTRRLMTPRGVVVVRRAEFDEIIELRHEVLRNGMPREAAVFDGDEAASTLHVGAFAADGRNVGCASFHLREFEGKPAWQLRGMASAAGWQSMGVGAAMLGLAEQVLREASEVRQLWCNARAPAVRFYVRQGWQVASDEFVIETAGPHVRMAKGIGDS